MKYFVKSAFALILASYSGPLFAQVGGGGGGGGLVNPLQFNTLQEFLVAILDALILILFPFLVLALVYAGFKFVAAQGKAEALVEARRAFLWVLIGALIILGAKALSMAIQATVDEITVKLEHPLPQQHPLLDRELAHVPSLTHHS